MSLLITGGTGYIGSKLVQQLKRKNKFIYSVGIKELNLLNYGNILNFLKKNNIKKVIHLGWCMENSNNAIYSNIEALINLIKSCEEIKIENFIFISTNNVYGIKNNGNLFVEEEILNVDKNNKYGISKYIGEKLVSYTLQEKSCIVRIADVYGPNQNHGNLIKGIISNIENKENLKLYGEGKRQRDYIYIDDVIRGLEFIYENNLKGIYNLGTGVGTSVKEIIDIVLKICQNRIDLDYIKVEKEDTSKVILNIGKLKKLGFSCNTTVEEGLKKIIEERGIN
ncbi:NAD(P)-dependent oxidoreductase [Leptotrichia shahii]|jgi:putative UDP-glucose 4-epimerase|uniref:NAD-dependent epimerase/dehydratase family protein n=1 Tax=Leptotrichia shahii TaxID=157691 RepID=UPI0028D67E8E|nr:NAD(P)-dependent oxidoreductase [Leptotrichia shahii]